MSMYYIKYICRIVIFLIQRKLYETHEHTNNDVIFQQMGSRYGLLREEAGRNNRGAARTKIQSNACTCTPNGEYIFKCNAINCVVVWNSEKRKVWYHLS